KELLFTDQMSFGIYAAYMSLVYVTPVIGGFVADRILGYRKAIVLGGILMAIGHVLLTIQTPVFFYGSLAIIIVGNGFFKPNISSFVGALYPKDSSRRDAGFTIFYMGINIGGAVAPMLCGWVALTYGWHFGFVLAGIGMLTGLLVFRRGLQKEVFGTHGLPPNNAKSTPGKFGLSSRQWVVITAVLAVPPMALLVKLYMYEHVLVWLLTGILIGILVYIYRTSDAMERSRLLVVVYFTLLASAFWAVFEQGGSSLTLFADRNVRLAGLSAAQTNSINSGFIMFLAIPFSMLWTYLNRYNRNIGSAYKFGIGLLLTGLAFVVFAASANHADADAQTPMFYLVAGYFVLTVGEMFLSPIGLSKATELSPAKYISFVMGVWFTSSFYGHFFAGKIAGMTGVSDSGDCLFCDGIWSRIIHWITGLNHDATLSRGEAFTQLYAYVSVYAVIGVSTLALGILALALAPFVKGRMKGVK
ncbi:MAG: peptide MFS transporter, partial [Flavobacteriales bacterium]|nr:peptide MFS transporter [Flavobacteriales bacterium]